MPIQIQEISNDSETIECPLCMEPLEVDDINFFPCVCGYQICRFCWHRIRTDENGLCPACRTSYPENPAEFRPLSGPELQKIRQEKRQKEVLRRQKLTDGRRHLAAIRVLQKNLVFVVGLSQRLSEQDILKRQDYFGKYGKILKVVINTNTAYAGAQGPSCSAYVTYSKMEEALRAIQAVNNVHIDGRTLKASLGTTKYCSTYLKNQQCHKQDCMYLHELAEEESSFTKEDMQAGKHQELERRLIDEMIQKEIDAAHAEQQSHEGANAKEGEKLTSWSRRHSASSTGPNQTQKVENSWMQNSDHGLSARLSSSLEDKGSGRKNSPQRKNKKISPRLAGKQPAQPVEMSKSDTGNISSECSSLTTTPPPSNIATTGTETRLTDDESNNSEAQVISMPTVEQCTTTESAITTPNIATVQQDEEPNKLCDATETLFISKPAQQMQPYKPFQRFNHSNEEFVNSEFNINSLLPPSMDPWNRGNSTSQQLPDAMPIKSSNDWEAAFGFGKTMPQSSSVSASNADAADDDLGFDPWLECNKGLADLIEKETATNNHLLHRGWSAQQLAQRHPMHNSPFSSRQDLPMANHLGSKSRSNFLPAGFSSGPNMNLPYGTPQNQLHRGENFSTDVKNGLSQSSTRKGLSDWQNGLRALLPSVNINFAMEKNQANSSVSSLHHNNSSMPGYGRSSMPQNPVSSGQDRQMLAMGFDDWAGPAPTQSQSAFFPNAAIQNQPSFYRNGFGLSQASSERYNTIVPPPGLGSAPYHNDPAIISTGSRAHVSMQHSTSMEEIPHWMKSLQTLTDNDSSMNPVATASSNFTQSTEPTGNTLSSWPGISNSGMQPLGGASQPPPGFRNRLPYANTSSFGIRHNLLENQS